MSARDSFLSTALLLGLPLALSAACTTSRPSGSQCVYNTDCTTGFVCLVGFCRSPCRGDPDCTAGQQCVQGSTPGLTVCAAPPGAPNAQPLCSEQQPCGSTGGVPNPCIQGVCSSRCRSDNECQTVSPSRPLCGADGVCVVPGADAGPLDAALEAAPEASVEAGFDAALEAAALDVALPDAPVVRTAGSTRPLSPLSTATVSTQRPLLRWAVGTTDRAPTGVLLCRNRMLTASCAPVALGSGAVPLADLTPGPWFWQLQGTMGTQPVWEFFVPSRSAARGSSYGSTMDLNGDGMADVAVSAPNANAGRGQVYVFYGGLRGLAAAPNVTLDSPTASSLGLGSRVASAGDLNGDGYGDLAVSDYRVSQALVYFGSNTGIPRTPSVLLRALDSSVFFGSAVAAGGDVDGDGYGDLLVGNPSGDSNVGRVYLVPGAATWPSTYSATQYLRGPAGALAFWGAELAGGGDFNGDGLSDFAVGARSAMSNRGQVFLYLGSATALPTSAAMTLTGTDATGLFGVSLASGGDLNGDGLADLAVGAQGAGSTAGQVSVFYGSAAGMPVSAGPVLAGPEGANGFFGTSVSLGDIDNDGYMDLAAGAPNAARPGTVYFYLGSSAGIPMTTTRGVPSPLTSASLFAQSMSFAGDVNGDGFLDLLVGAPAANGRSGQAFLFPGSATGPAAPSAWMPTAPTDPDAGFGFSVAQSLRPWHVLLASR